MEGLIGSVSSSKRGLATTKMYNLQPKPLIATTTNEYIKICTINSIAVGSILYTVGNQDSGINFCGIIDVTVSSNVEGRFKLKLTKLSGSDESVQIYYKKDESGKIELAVKNPIGYGYHTAISNTDTINMNPSKFTDIAGWTLVS